MVKKSIGVAVTTHNRASVFAKSIVAWRRMLPADALLVVVDDGSDVPVPPIPGVTVVRHEVAQGIAGAKNAGLRALEGCEHVFLADDDVWPVDPHWWLPYTQSVHKHLCLSFEFKTDGRRLADDVRLVGTRPDVWVYGQGNGCLMYATRECVDRVGGYDTGYGRWGFEHRDWSMRIYNAGLTEYPFMDVPDGKRYFRILDREGVVESSVPESVRREHSLRNGLRYAQLGSATYKVELMDGER